MRNLCLILVVLMCWSVTSNAQSSQNVWHSGNDFLSICAVDADKSPTEQTLAELRATSACIPYLRGLHDGIVVATAEVHAPYCAPAEVTNNQMEQILVKYLRDHPERAHYLTPVLFLDAMGTAFPCLKKSTK
jgi:hypothetical protein